MALIGTIRKNTWLLVVLIAVGMGGFILQSIVSGSNRYAAGDRTTVGKVNGKKIDYREFQETERVLYGNSTDNVYANKSNLWNYFKNKTLAETMSDKLGLGVSTEELINLEFGDNLSPIISARFKNKQTGAVDKEQLNQIKKMIDDGSLNPEYKKFWAVQEKEITYDRLKTKMSNLVSKAMYAPKWYVEDVSKMNGTKASFKYVKIPFEKVADDQIEVTDQAIQEYIDEHKNMYTNEEERRAVKYATFEVKPTDKDVAALKAKAEQIAKDFKTAEDDSLFIVTHEGVIGNVYYKYDELPEALRKDSVRWNKGDVIGPYRDKDLFTVAKILNKKMVPDSVHAKHILRSVAQGDAEGFAKAKATIDSLKTLLETGKESFDSLAVKFSQDPGSAKKGGDLGTFAQGRMVPAFNYACFNGKKGDLYEVTTRFGVHLIKIEDQKFLDNEPKYKVGYINIDIVPSQETQDSIYDVASEIITSSTDATAFEENIKKHGLTLKKSMPLKANDYTFMDLGSGQTSREIIKWAFEPGTEKGDIAPTVYTYTNKKLYYNDKYVLGYLSAIYPKGLRSVDEVRNDIEQLVKNQLKGKKIKEMIKSENLDEVASQFDLKVESADNVPFSSKFVNNLGNEPQVLYYAFNGETGKVYGPIIGNSGVFLVSPVSIEKPSANADFVSEKKKLSDAARTTVTYRLFDALSKEVEIQDNRQKFY